MRVTKWGNSLAVRLPRAVVDAPARLPRGLEEERDGGDLGHVRGAQQAPVAAEPQLHVLDRGQRVPLDLRHLTVLIESACAELGSEVRPEPILAETKRNLYDGVPIEEVHKASILAARTLIEKADVVVVRFGEQYRQWNAAFDAGYAAALGKPLVTLHPPEHDHALKEVDRAALAVAREPEQVVEILRYALAGAAA